MSRGFRSWREKHLIVTDSRPGLGPRSRRGNTGHCRSLLASDVSGKVSFLSTPPFLYSLFIGHFLRGHIGYLYCRTSWAPTHSLPPWSRKALGLLLALEGEGCPQPWHPGAGCSFCRNALHWLMSFPHLQLYPITPSSSKIPSSKESLCQGRCCLTCSCR